MLYCQPDSFYHEMKYISDNQPTFLQKLSLSEYKLPTGITHIEPISYLLQMIVNQPADNEDNKIFAIRTYGVYNSLEVSKEHKFMQVYFAFSDSAFIYIAKPRRSDIIFVDDEILFTTYDEFGDTYAFSIDEIAIEKINPYAMYSYVRFGEYMFEPHNLMALIPKILVQNLV